MSPTILTGDRAGEVAAGVPAASLEELITGLAGDERLVHVERLPARHARHATLAVPLPPAVEAVVPAGGLWTHQAAAIDLLRAGTSVAIATGTASGKSTCYQLPIAEASAADPPATALLLFPTKALAHDQLRALTELATPGLVPHCYDGDSSPDERAWARRHATALLTNPDMLHVGLLPHHARWATFLLRLRYVVVDELHLLRGVFGTHVAHVLRRLRRVCAAYGSDPTFVFTSATIGNPGRLAGSLCGKPVVEVLDDGSPQGERLFALWNPPVTDSRRGTRVPANAETARVLAGLVDAGHRTIAFCRSRRSTELVASDAQRRLPPDTSSLVRPYRGGYLTRERREIEAELFGGRLRGVVATSALELGVDIGTLDACVLDGFPGTIASMWQQAGRAGRARQRSLSVLVAGDDQLDQWLMAHPSEVFTRSAEPAVINPANPSVLLPHLACAAYELPLSPADERWWGDDLDEGVRHLVVDDHLKVRDGRAYWSGRGSPAWGVGLRSGSADEVRIATPDGQLVGTVDGSRACATVHPGAVYLHQGQAYEVTALDLEDLVAWVTPHPGDETTQVRSATDIRILESERSATVGGVTVHLGAVEVSEQVVGYQRRHVASGEVVANASLDLPAGRLLTRAFWFVVAPEVLLAAGVAPERWPGTLHAMEHAAIGVLPLFTICDRWDVGGVSTPLQADTAKPTIVIYDGYPGGAGIAELGHESAERLLATTLDVIAGCGCADGCPSCVQSPKCGNLNEPLDKPGAEALLREILRSTAEPPRSVEAVTSPPA